MSRDDAKGEFDGGDAENAVDELGSDTPLDTIDDGAIAAYVTNHGLVEAGRNR